MRYAKALMEYAKSTGTEESFYLELATLSHNLMTCPDLHRALENPTLTAKEKASLISAATVGAGTLRKEFANFVDLVLKNRREDLLQYISLDFLDLYRKSRHIGVAKLTTAVPVSAEMEQRIRNSASSVLHARMELNTEVDPSIEGGFIFDINDYRLDASIATQLKRVKQQFIDKNRRIV